MGHFPSSFVCRANGFAMIYVPSKVFQMSSIVLSSAVLLLANVILDAKILNNIIMQIADGKISAWSKHHVF